VTGIDTNVLLRYFVDDDRLQFAASRKLFEERLRPESPGYVSAIVLVETVWVLARRYGLGRDEIVPIVETMLGEKRLVLEHQNEVYFALAEYRTGDLDFSDALIAAIASAAGCGTTVTFDKRASRHRGFTLLA
jgi:predicted nucleic-acid-binding protein